MRPTQPPTLRIDPPGSTEPAFAMSTRSAAPVCPRTARAWAHAAGLTPIARAHPCAILTSACQLGRPWRSSTLAR